MEQYRFLAELLPVQVWTSLPDGALDFVSSQTARYFGATPEQILRDGWKDFVHPEDLAQAGAKWMHSLATGETYEVNFRLRMADGRYHWHIARAVAHRGPDGAIIRWFGTNTNIEEEREEQRRTRALLEEVTTTTAEQQRVVKELREALEGAQARIAELEHPK